MTAEHASLTAAELAGRLGGELVGDGARIVERVAPLNVADERCVSWLGSASYASQLEATRAAAVIISRSLALPEGASAGPRPAMIVVADADVALCSVLGWLSPPPPRVPPGVHATAVIEAGAVVEGAAIGPHVFVGAGARIGPRTQLHAGVYVGAESVIGADCTLWPNVVVRERVTLGERIIIHANATIGADGFGYLPRDGVHVKIPQVGTVVIEDDVEIGANSAVDRARSGATRIGRGTKIDNFVQIGHNSTIGEHCIIVAQCGLSGSTVMEHHAVLGGQVGITDHLRIGTGARIAAKTLVIRDVPAGQSQMGNPAIPSREFLRQQVLIRKLPELNEQIRALIKRVEQLESAADDRNDS